MDRIHLIVYGEPQGKARPRVTMHGTYTPAKTMSYERQIRSAYLACSDGTFWDKGVPLSVDIQAFYSIPKSAPKKKFIQMLEGTVFPTKKPDVDNVIKIVLDSLNGVAFHDDAQVVKCGVTKNYSETPRIEVVISLFS